MRQILCATCLWTKTLFSTFQANVVNPISAPVIPVFRCVERKLLMHS